MFAIFSYSKADFVPINTGQSCGGGCGTLWTSCLRATVSFGCLELGPLVCKIRGHHNACAGNSCVSVNNSDNNCSSSCTSDSDCGDGSSGGTGGGSCVFSVSDGICCGAAGETASNDFDDCGTVYTGGISLQVAPPNYIQVGGYEQYSFRINIGSSDTYGDNITVTFSDAPNGNNGGFYDFGTGAYIGTSYSTHLGFNGSASVIFKGNAGPIPGSYTINFLATAPGSTAGDFAYLDVLASDGVCGTDVGNFDTPPGSNLCSSGGAGTVSLNGGTWTWSCNGSGNGSSTSCQRTSSFTLTSCVSNVCTGTTNPGYFYYPNKDQMISSYCLSSYDNCSVPVYVINGTNYWFRQGGKDTAACQNLQTPPPVCAPPAISLSSLTNISAVAGATAPASQALTITNTGGSILNWRATSTTPSICTLSKLTGTAVANNGTDSLGVIFASPVASMVSTSPNNCSITVSDQGGVAASKQASNTYTVTVGPPGGGGAGSVTAAQAICPTMGVVINWSAGPGATSYQIYRKRHGTIGTSVIATVGNVLTYTDTTGTNGTYYDYFVQSVGNATQVAASSNSGTGITPNTCSGGAGPGSVVTSNGTCSQISLSWDAVAAASGYNVYRGSNNIFASSTKIASNKPLATPGSPYVDTTVTGGSVYYYFVTGIVSGLETTSTVSSGASTNACTANMSNSDKIITAVNGVDVANVPALGSCGNSTINLPANTALNLGDKLSFRIDLCNTTNNSDADATNIYVTDTFTNLATSSLVTSFNAKLYTNVGTTVVLTYDNGCSGTSAPAQNNHYCVYGTAPNQTLKFNLSDSSNNLPAHTGYAALTFDAALSVAPNTNGVSSRFYNNYNISYTGPTSPSGTISWPFYLGNQVPIIHEVP